MMRLLDTADLDFLRCQPGFTPRLASQLRAQRCQIFRGYLRCLNADFQRVCMAIKLLILQSRSDRPDLSFLLMRQQVIFATGMASVHIRLVLYRWGFCGVDVTGLVRMFDSMRLELTGLMPAAMPAGA
jgi:hypothetical protein